VVIVDAALTPIQQRNLEREWSCKVIDRTGVILEIFGSRARTREGRLQVELAALTYQRSRLVRSWTHLERQRGGAGFMGGPGERQIETDRRLIDQKITRLKRGLKEVRRTRNIHRKARQRVPYPQAVIVGYTNAGKSTLFNALTKADVTVEDQLFATLDPTMRSVILPSGRSIILSDTVGFISDLPHELVDAFHATLEEVIESDIVIHLRNAAHPDKEAQKQDVLKVLKSIGLKEGEEGRTTLEVFNKIDLLSPEEKEILASKTARSQPHTLSLSAITREGIEGVLGCLDEILAKSAIILDVVIAPEDGATLAWLYEHAEVLERQSGEEEGETHLKVRLDAINEARFAAIMKNKKA
jgi:GTPase